jgi:HTH-type transcriptional regulator/antitoxin HigA
MSIRNETEYRHAFEEFERLTAAMGDDPVKQAQARAVAERIQAYEREFVPFPSPTTLAGMVELRMHELRLGESEVADLLGIDALKLEGLLNGEASVDFELAKKLHEKLGIDGNFILETA